MRRQYWLALVAAIGLGVGAQAQSGIAGKWVGETQGRGGTQAVTLVLTVNGDDLTGTFTQGDQETDIEEGAIDGNTITFQRAVGQGGFTLEYTGVLDGDTLTLTPMFNGGPRGGGRPGGGPPPGAGQGRGDGQGRGGGRGGPQTIELKRQ